MTILLMVCARAKAPFLLVDARTSADGVGFVLVSIAPPKSPAMVDLMCCAPAKATIHSSEPAGAMTSQRVSALAQVSQRKNSCKKGRRIVFPLLLLIVVAIKKLACSSGQYRQSQTSRWIQSHHHCLISISKLICSHRCQKSLFFLSEIHD